VLAGSPEPVQDWTYGGTSVDPHVMQVLGFNPYAVFPSVHVLWALIPAWCLATGSRSRWVWLSALCLPVLMILTVICTGNHYVLDRSEEHTSELQSQSNLVCRLLLEKKNRINSKSSMD